MHAYCLYIQLLRQLPKEHNGKTDYSQVVGNVEIRGRSFKMLPDTWSNSNWEINATVTPALVSIYNSQCMSSKIMMSEFICYMYICCICG